MASDLARAPLVVVFWDDAHGNSIGEYTDDEIFKQHRPAPIKTFGLLVLDNADGITLAADETAEPGSTTYTHYRGINFIPRGMVREVISFGIPKRPRKPREVATPECPPSVPS